MHNKKRYYFFTCVHCGTWYYSWKRIKSKKCWSCNRTFKFEDSKKFSRICSSREAIAIAKELKKENINDKEKCNTHFYSLSSK
ncbi:MAG: DUF1922 domain-containing protein [Promethearchaeota archaeon]|nr:MAG: DUF1922 domain-containing protein [Candidatus Lokiarchaeota archaeon]